MSKFPGQSAALETTSMGAPRPGAGAGGQESFHAADAGQALFRLDVKRSLQLHWRAAAVVAAVGMVLAVAYFLRLWPIYVAQSLVYVQPAAPRLLDGNGSRNWPFDNGTYESYIQQQIADVTREDVLEGALHKLPAGVWQHAGESDQVAADRLSHAVDVARNSSYQFAIEARASNPGMAADLANAVTASYLEVAAREQKAGDTQRIAILREEQDRIEKELTADRSEQADLNKELGVAALGTGAPDLIDDDIARTRGALNAARTEHDQAEAKFDAMDAGKGPSSTAIESEADEMIATDSGLSSMKTSLNQRRAALITQMANLTPNHPEYKQDEAELAKINSTIDGMMKDLRAKAAARVEQRLHTDLERTAGVEAQLNGQLRQLVSKAGSAAPKMQRANDLAADVARLQARYTAVDDQLHNLMLDAGAPGSVYLTAAALPPLHPVRSGVIRNAILLAAFSLVFGVLVAVARHKMDPHLYVASDVEQVLGFAPMAQLPDFNEVSEAVAEEHLLRLAAALDHGRRQGTLQSCVLTGTGMGTGVTTIAARVQELLEGMGRPAALVDGLSAPRAIERTGENQEGEAGQRHPSAGMLQRAEEEGLVLTDAAPLMISAETEYLARFADCVLVVMESGVTTRAQLRATAQTLQRLNVTAVGFVLNHIGLAKADPGFRHTVSEMEKHRRGASRTAVQRPVRSRHAEEEPRDAASAAPAAMSALEEASVEEAAPRTAAPAPLPPPRAYESIPPAREAAGDTELPWWLAETGRRPPGTQAEQVWQPVPVGAPEPKAARHVPEPEERPAPAPPHSRLSGLRSVLFTKGLDHLHKQAEPAHVEAEPLAPPVEKETISARVSVSRTFVPHPELEPMPAEGPREVTAAPEFLPPRAPEKSKRHFWEREATDRRDRRDAYDDVAILPSWRGQYRKRD